MQPPPAGALVQPSAGAVAAPTTPITTRSASGVPVQPSATPGVAPTTPITTRRSASLNPQGLRPTDSVVLSSCQASSSHSATKRARFDKDDHGGAAGKAQTQQQPIARSVVTRGDQPPPSGLWARPSGLLATPKGQGNLAPAVVQVYKHTCYTLVH